MWEHRLPTTASPIHELAYGRGGSSLPAADALAGLETETPDAILEPVAVSAPVRKHKPAAKLQAPVQVAAMSAPAPEPAPHVSVTPSAEPELLAQNDAADRYAERETQAQKQSEFRGGDAIIISAGALVVVLLIVVLILLLR